MESTTSLTNISEEPVRVNFNIHPEGLISDEAAVMVQYVVDLWINSILSYIGVIGNIAQIIVFSRLGFKETMNISMTFIGAWDLLRCVFNCLHRVFGVIDLFSPAMAISWYNISIVVGSYLSAIAGYVSSVLAGYVAVERCLCVSLPFTVRHLLTRQMVIITNSAISVIVFGSMIIVFPCHEIYSVFSPVYNETVYLWRFNSLWTDNPEVDDYLSTVYILWIVLSFLVICISTGVITYHLEKASKFRNNNNISKIRNISLRDRQVMKMLLLIIAVYIVNSLPRILFMVIRLLVPEFDNNRRYHNSLWVSVNVMNIFDFINAAINPFIFYFMSSQFKSIFLMTFCSKARA